MEAIRPDGNQKVDAEPDLSTTQGVRSLAGVELDRRIRVGWEVWCELLDDLLCTGGMLPSRELAGRVVGFFEDGYWRAEDARIEVLRRRLLAGHIDRVPDRVRGLW